MMMMVMMVTSADFGVRHSWCWLEQQGSWRMCLQHLAGPLGLPHMVAGFPSNSSEDEYQCISTFPGYASIVLVNDLVIKASHMAQPRFTGGRKSLLFLGEVVKYDSLSPHPPL